MKNITKRIQDAGYRMWQGTVTPSLGTAGVAGPAIPTASSFGKLFADNPSLSGIFNKLFVFAITVGAILAVVRLVYGGFIYMTRDIWSSKQSAVTMIQQAVIGLLLLLAVYLILYQINPQILKLEFLAPPSRVGSFAAPPGSLTRPAP